MAIEMQAQLNGHLGKLKADLTDDEFKIYRKAFAQVMGNLLLDIMMPLYAEHPDLKPVEIGGPYVLPEHLRGRSEQP